MRLGAAMRIVKQPSPHGGRGRVLLWAGLLLLGAIIAAIGLLSGDGVRADSWPLAVAPAVDVDRLRAVNPAAAALASQAEAAIAGSRLSEALALYEQAARMAPRSGLPDRRRCELLTALGQRDSAIEACNLATTYGGSVRDLRAAAGAVISGPRPPTSDQVVTAFSIATGAQRLLPAQPYGYAALADIARRIGDGAMLAANVESLQHYAPTHDETQRAQALRPGAHRGLRLAAWAIVLLAALAAVGSAIRRRLGRGRQQVLGTPPTGLGQRALSMLVACTALAGSPLVLAASPPATAAPSPAADEAEPAPMPTRPPEQLGSYPIDDANPSAHLPTPEEANANPLQFGYLLMDLATKAELAEKRKDYGGAVRYYLALAKAVPNRSVSYGKMCRNLELMGDRDNGLWACREALGREGVRVDDYQRYVRLLLDHKGPVTAAETSEVNDIAKHLREDAATNSAADEIDCQLGARTSDIRILTACVAGLTAVSPKDPKTISYQWVLAVEKQDYDEATRLMRKATSAGLKPEGAVKMEEMLRAKKLRSRMPLLGAGILLGLGGVVVVILRLRKRASQTTARMLGKAA